MPWHLYRFISNGLMIETKKSFDLKNSHNMTILREENIESSQ